MARTSAIAAAVVATIALATPQQGGSAATTSPWLCVMGINSPIRINTAGNVECLSTNHHDCAWQTNHEECVAVKYAQQIDPLAENPLVCGTDHLKEWGVTGYDSPTHWCARAYRTLVRPTAPTAWTCVPNVSTPVRVNPTTGEVECMSSNHHDCLWQSSAEDCQALVDTRAPAASIDPVACGAMHQVEWGDPGYGTANHWCELSRKALAPRSWECVGGIFTPVRRTPTGNIQCLSTNGNGCVWQASESACKAVVASLGTSPAPPTKTQCSTVGGTVKCTQVATPVIAWGAIHPWTCSAADFAAPNHWCQKAKAYYDTTKTTTMLSALARASIASVEWTSVGFAAAGVIVASVLAVLAIVRQRDSSVQDDPAGDFYMALDHT
ncbi:hypothetical protein DYB32_009840 [Aphanomyces invadans]|uniref:SRCR domain-containing protein n=1 Tax=Aphanomyces invadans TaxID=157072 RepID=A0A3R6WEX3_9STRA|nr:hypothetical protein DYB32_009840 [Aphanomyces invadans]